MPDALALVWILAPALVLAVGALVCLILGLFYVLYLKPLLDWITRRGGGFLGRLIRWVARPVVSHVKGFVARHVQLLMRSFVTGIAPMVLTLNQLAVVTQRMSGTIADMAEQTWRALWTLRHVTVPRLITTALVPVKAQLVRHTDRLDALEDLNRRVAVVAGAGLRSLPWGAPGSYVGNFASWWDSYRHLWRQHFDFTVPRLNRVQFEIIPELAQRVRQLETRVTLIRDEALPAIRQRLGRIEDRLGAVLTDPSTWVLAALGAAMLPALSVAGMRTALRNLTCRNTQRVARDVCAMDAGLLDDLLALALIFVGSLSIVEFAKALQPVTSFASDAVNDWIVES